MYTVWLSFLLISTRVSRLLLIAFAAFPHYRIDIKGTSLASTRFESPSETSGHSVKEESR